MRLPLWTLSLKPVAAATLPAKEKESLITVTLSTDFLKKAFPGLREFAPSRYAESRNQRKAFLWDFVLKDEGVDGSGRIGHQVLVLSSGNISKR